MAEPSPTVGTPKRNPRRNLPAVVTVGFALAIVLLLFNQWAAYRSAAEFIAAAEWSAHTYQVLEAISDLDVKVERIRSRSRGYVITGNDMYRDVYNEGEAAVTAALRRLDELVTDNPLQHQRLQALAAVVTERLKFSAETVRVRRVEGFAAAAVRVASGQGNVLNDKVRTATDVVAQAERNLLGLRNAARSERADQIT
ncbi:MAG: CHASE3 domain-containing protein, partial [bacterium]